MDLQSLKIERPRPGARTPRRHSPWPVRLVVLGAFAVLAWLFGPALLSTADRLRLPSVRTFVVTAATPASAAAVRGTAANGYVVAARRAALSSDVPGRIVELAVREGSVVKKGDIVARLFADEFRAALQRAEADRAAAANAVARAKAARQASAAELEQALASEQNAAAQNAANQALLTFAEQERVRTAELARTEAGSQRDADRARSEAEAASARQRASAAALAASASTTLVARQRLVVAAGDVSVAEAQLAAADASRDLAQATLDKTDVRAPFDGIVVLKDAEVGEVVSPNVQGGSNARGAVCTMVDFDSLEVQANVPETTLASVRLGAPADVFLDAYPDERYEGTVDRIWPTADRQKATIEVRVKLARRDERLRPEMGVRIVFRAADAPPPEASSAKAAVLVPEEAVVTVDGVLGAFVLERDIVRFASITAGERKNGRIAVQAGLSPNQRIVLAPPASLKSGDRVQQQP